MKTCLVFTNFSTCLPIPFLTFYVNLLLSITTWKRMSRFGSCMLKKQNLLRIFSVSSADIRDVYTSLKWKRLWRVRFLCGTRETHSANSLWILVDKSLAKRQLGIPRRKWKENIRTIWTVNWSCSRSWSMMYSYDSTVERPDFTSSDLRIYSFHFLYVMKSGCLVWVCQSLSR
jgi:hypothetical protein